MKAATSSDPQKIWGVRMALSLFLAGTASGAYLTGFILSAVPGHAALADESIPASAILAALALSALAWHARRKTNLLLAFSRPRTSWMSRGAIALSLFFVLTVVDAVLWLARDGYVSGAVHLALGAVTSVVAMSLLVYSGMLLKSLKPIAFWDSVWLPVVFFLSGIAGGLVLLALGLGISQAAGTDIGASVVLVVAFALGFLVVEAGCTAVYLWSAGAGESAPSARAILRGRLAPSFWLGAAAVGVVVPIVICAYSLEAPSAGGLIGIGVAGLVGNAILKCVIVTAGGPKAMRLAGVAVPAPVAARMTVSQYMQQVNQKA